MARKTNLEKFVIEENVLREQVSSRGGGIEISCDALGKKYEGVKMTAYQNYLGGGMLGAVGGDCNMEGWEEDDNLVELQERLKKHYHSLTNPEYDEWAGSSYEANQRRSLRAY